MERKFAKGKTTEEQINRLDKTLQHFSRRLSHKVIGLVPSAPVFQFIQVPQTDGVVLKGIFPASGRISKAAIFVANKTSKGPSIFQMEIKRGERYWAEAFEVRKVPLVSSPNIAVEAGDLFTLSVQEPDKISGIWVGFLYEVGIPGLGKKEVVLDQLEQLIKEDLDVQED